MKRMSDIIEAARKAGRKRVAVAAAHEESALEAVFDAAGTGLSSPY
jgi:hypothetical protein